MPTEVRVACILTWIVSGLTASVYLMLIVGVAVDRNGLLDLMRDNPSIRDTSLSDDQLVGLLIAVSAFVIAWCLVACVVAVLTWRRHNAARVALLVSVGVAVTIEVLGLPYSLLHLAACAAAFVMLLREPTRAWFRRADQARASAPPSRDWPPPDAGSQPPPPAQYPPPPPPESPSGKPPVW